MHNPTKRELAEERRYLLAEIGPNVGWYEFSRQQALSDAKRVIVQRYQGQYLSVSDYGLRATLESRGDNGYGEAGSVHEGSGAGRWWTVLWHWETGERRLRQR